MIKLGSSSGQASSYVAEPPGTSVYDSEAPSEQSHSTSHHPQSSSIHASQPFNLTLRPDPTILGAADANNTAPDTSRTEHSSASSASFTGTDKSRRDVADEAEPLDSSPASDLGVDISSEDDKQPGIVHQTSGIRYLLDGVLEKVSDAFARHQPRGTPRPTAVSDPSEDPDNEDDEEGVEHSGAELLSINSGNVGIRYAIANVHACRSHLVPVWILLLFQQSTCLANNKSISNSQHKQHHGNVKRCQDLTHICHEACRDSVCTSVQELQVKMHCCAVIPSAHQSKHRALLAMVIVRISAFL